MTLENAFYTIGIIYMAVSLLLVMGLVVAILVIRAKVVSLEKMIKEKVNVVSSLPSQVAEIVQSVKKATGRKSH